MWPDYPWGIFILLSELVVQVTARVDFSVGEAFPPISLPIGGQGPSLLYRGTVLPSGLDY